jgi:phage-related protein (TIGR01555 family)
MAARATSDKNFIGTKDSFTNFVARLGVGEKNQLSGSYYNFGVYVTRNRTQLEAAYRGAWLVRAAVDFPAEDMTRAGVDLESTLEPKQIDILQNRIMDLCIWNRVAKAIKWARLFGGAIIVPLIDGQDPSKPLRLETIRKGQFKGLLILDRWMVNPSLYDLITDFGPELGYPKYYEVVAAAPALPNIKIHHSRAWRIEGCELPYYQWLAENMWGESIVEVIHDRLISFDSASLGAAQLAYKAHLRTYSIEQLRDIIATGGQAFEAMMKQVQLMRVTQSNEGVTLLDAKDKFETHQYSFAGLSDVILQMGQQLAGALQIPLVRLFGQSPAGLNSTGESDLRTYYDSIKKQQENVLRRPLVKLFHIMFRSELGMDPPEDFNFKFNPLWVMTETEKAEIANKDQQTILGAFNDGLISQECALKELRQLSHISGRFSNITDEDIALADDKPPKPPDPENETEVTKVE